MEREFIDLRSDTVTRPTKAMLEAMMTVAVGDDVYDEDPTVNLLQQKAAEMFGMEAALFCPSGTMTNQIAIKVHTKPGDEVICDKLSHIYNYEGGGIMFNSGASVKLIDGKNGKPAEQEILENINPDNVHFPVTKLVSLENTVNKAGGNYYTLQEIEPLYKACKKNALKLHLDGARLFNALVETGENPKDYGKYFDTISICLSKGLGAPVGSLLIGCESDIKQAKRVRKVFGGGMRQAGILAAAGIYALGNNIQRLKDDHKRASIISEELRKFSWIEEIYDCPTNIVIFKMQSAEKVTGITNYLKDKNILVSAFGPVNVRMVTHLDFDDNMLEKLVDALKDYRRI